MHSYSDMYHRTNFLVWMSYQMIARGVRGDHGIDYAEMCDPYGGSSYYQESIDLDKRVRRIRTNSCPHHFNICQQAECAGNLTYATQHDTDIEIPLYPGIARDDHVKSLRCTSGTLAVSFNGVGIQSLTEGTETCGTPEDYGAQNGIGSSCNLNGIDDGTKYCGDQVIAYAAEFDMCGGHADRGSGLYHYHIPPSCLINDLGVVLEDAPSSTPYASLHSVQIGWAYDGFPVYGPRGPDGILMMPCTSPGSHDTLCLDSCNGYYGRLVGVDEYLYRYYMTGPTGSSECSDVVDSNNEMITCQHEEDKCCTDITPPVAFAPYSLGCFRGCAYNDLGCLLSNELEGTSEFFFPKISNYLILYAPGDEIEVVTPGPEVMQEDIDNDISETEYNTSDIVEPVQNSDEEEGTNLNLTAARSVLHRVLSPYRGFAISSSSGEGTTEVMELLGDNRGTYVIGGLSLGPLENRIYYTTQNSVAWVSDDGDKSEYF